MNSNGFAKHYDKLTPEERFRLIMAAGTRGDEAETDRLTRAAKRISISMPDHSPYVDAFQELILVAYIEMLDSAAFYRECNERFHDQLRDSIDTAKNAEDDTEEALTAEDDVVKYPAWHRAGELVYAAGFLLKAKLAGWKLFCERWSDAPFAAWEEADFPGLDRLKLALARAEAGTAFPTSADMVRWLNGIRPAGDPEATEADIMTAERFADSFDAAFRERVRWWGG
jgi:hypothetical protein